MKQKIDSIIGGIIRSFYIYNDTYLGAFLAVVSAILFSMSFSIKIVKEPVSAVDTARFFPQLVFGVLVPIGVVLIVRGIIKSGTLRESAPQGEVLDAQILAFKRSIVALIAIAVFIAGMEPVGYIPMAIIYMVFNMFYMSERAAWKPWLFILVAVLVAAASYFLFRQFVYVRLPAGILKGVLG